MADEKATKLVALQVFISRTKTLVFAMVVVLLGSLFLYTISLFADDSHLPAYIKLAKESVFRLNFTNGVYTGTGFMINTLGNMLTCAHVVDSSQDLSGKYVKALLAENYLTLSMTGDLDTVFNDVVTYSVTVDTVIPSVDLALLTVDLKNPHFKENKNSNFFVTRPPFMRFSNSDSVWEGQEVFTCAYIKDPFIIPKPIIAKGIISTTRNKFYDPRMKNKVDILQLDLNISKGNSGGPVFLLDQGRVIGIIDWGISTDSKWQTSYAVALSTNQIVAKLKQLGIPFDYK